MGLLYKEELKTKVWDHTSKTTEKFSFSPVHKTVREVGYFSSNRSHRVLFHQSLFIVELRVCLGKDLKVSFFGLFQLKFSST